MSIFFDLLLKTIYKNPRIIWIFLEKSFKFFSSKNNQVLFIQFMPILLLIKIDIIV